MDVNKTSVEKLRDKLHKVQYVESLNHMDRKKFDLKKFLKQAREVKKTFSDEDLARFGYFQQT